MSWVDLIKETDVDSMLGVSGSSFLVADVPLRLFKAEPTIADSDERRDGRTVFAVMGNHHIYITPDQATAMGVALIRAAAQERAR